MAEAELESSPRILSWGSSKISYATWLMLFRATDVSFRTMRMYFLPV